MTSKLTREENVQAVFDLKSGYTLGLADVEILKRVARMALAAMGSEAKESISFDEWSRKCALQITLCYPDFREKAQYIWDSARETQQPAPVVPDRSIFEQWWESQNGAPLDGWDSLRTTDGYCDDGIDGQFEAWNACRAAMLQAGNCRENANTSTNNCREITETSTKRTRDHFISLCNEFWNWSEMDMVCAEDRGYEMRMEWDGKVFKHPVTQALWRMYQAAPGNSPVIPDGYVMVPMRLTAENGAKGALSGEFSETKFVNCLECFGDDECETCDGSGRIEIKVPVSWTTIKEIWIKGVEHFAAAPQENN